MERERQSVHKVQVTEGKRSIIQQLLEEFDNKMLIQAKWFQDLASNKSLLC